MLILIIITSYFKDSGVIYNFLQDLSKCTTTGFRTIENVHKPLVLKDLKKLWNKEDPDLQWEIGEYTSSNTLLIDDSPYKALCNPVSIPSSSVFLPYG